MLHYFYPWPLNFPSHDHDNSDQNYHDHHGHDNYDHDYHDDDSVGAGSWFLHNGEQRGDQQLQRHSPRDGKVA